MAGLGEHGAGALLAVFCLALLGLGGLHLFITALRPTIALGVISGAAPDAPLLARVLPRRAPHGHAALLALRSSDAAAQGGALYGCSAMHAADSGGEGRSEAEARDECLRDGLCIWQHGRGCVEGGRQGPIASVVSPEDGSGSAKGTVNKFSTILTDYVNYDYGALVRHGQPVANATATAEAEARAAPWNTTSASRWKCAAGTGGRGAARCVGENLLFEKDKLWLHTPRDPNVDHARLFFDVKSPWGRVMAARFAPWYHTRQCQYSLGGVTAWMQMGKEDDHYDTFVLGTLLPLAHTIKDEGVLERGDFMMVLGGDTAAEYVFNSWVPILSRYPLLFRQELPDGVCFERVVAGWNAYGPRFHGVLGGPVDAGEAETAQLIANLVVNATGRAARELGEPWPSPPASPIDVRAAGADARAVRSPESNGVPLIVVSSRASMGRRRMLNEPELCDYIRVNIMRHVRCQTVDMASLSILEQVRLAQETDVLVGMHGGGLVNVLFMAAGAGLLEVLPPGVDNQVRYERLARMVRVRYSHWTPREYNVESIVASGALAAALSEVGLTKEDVMVRGVNVTADVYETSGKLHTSWQTIHDELIMAQDVTVELDEMLALVRELLDSETAYLARRFDRADL